MKVKELINELKQKDQNMEVRIREYVFVGNRHIIKEDEEENQPFFDTITLPIKSIYYEAEDKTVLIEFNKYD